VAWPRDHKAHTHARIVEAAASAFRAQGLAGVGVAEIMDRAGLTHGGFYAHFSSKDELLAEALEAAGREALASLSESADAVAAEDRLRAVVDTYLSAEHAEHPERGCPIAALAPELVRSDPKVRSRLARGIRSRLAWLRRLAPRRRPRGRAAGDQAVGALACMLGGVILARGLGGPEGRAVLEACRTFLLRATGDAKARKQDKGKARRWPRRTTAPRSKA